MPVHFAASRHVSRSPVARILAPTRLREAHNDNGAVSPLADPGLQAALRFFGEFGLSASAVAANRARQAAAMALPEAAREWTEICALFDPRLAATLPE